MLYKEFVSTIIVVSYFQDQKLCKFSRIFWGLIFPEKDWFPVQQERYGLLLRSIHWRCSVKKVFLEILQYSQEKTCARFSFLILKKSLWHRCFFVNFAKFVRTFFLQNTSGRMFWSVKDLFSKCEQICSQFCHSLTAQTFSRYGPGRTPYLDSFYAVSESVLFRKNLIRNFGVFEFPDAI